MTPTEAANIEIRQHDHVSRSPGGRRIQAEMDRPYLLVRLDDTHVRDCKPESVTPTGVGVMLVRRPPPANQGATNNDQAGSETKSELTAAQVAFLSALTVLARGTLAELKVYLLAGGPE